MPPLPADKLKGLIKSNIQQNKVMVFSKSYCPFCKKVKGLFASKNIAFHAIELDTDENGPKIQAVLLEMYGQKTVPCVFINTNLIGGYTETQKLADEDKLLSTVSGQAAAGSEKHYDLIVIGGGSGGIASAVQAAELGKSVALFDFVKPSPRGSTWGLGGTCVNVGCIPKKLMHQTALLGHSIADARTVGWKIDNTVNHNWQEMTETIINYIKSLNFGYRAKLRKNGVTYYNASAVFTGPNKIAATDKKGNVNNYSAEQFILATGMRPFYPEPFIGCQEHCITSDDLFTLPQCPGKTLVVGASYVSLECAGFLAGLGLDVTVMVRSILLRGFDQEVSEKVGSYMESECKIKFIRPCIPTLIKQNGDGKYAVEGKNPQNGDAFSGVYDTVLIAVGRLPCTSNIGLDKVGVKTDSKGFVIVDDCEKTSVDNIYAIGDIALDKPELTPMAIQSGRLLVQRLFNNSSVKCDYINVPTTVFTPIEYGSIGLSEESAIEMHGAENVEIYHSDFMALEWTINPPSTNGNPCYAKLITNKKENERIIGLHILSPNAGEITQGFAVGFKLGATKKDFDSTIGIHPTCAETFTTLNVTKSSGVDSSAGGC